MSHAIISVQDLGKKYRIRHEQERQKYATLRDLLAERTGTAVRQMWALFTRGACKQNRRRLVEDFWALRNVSLEIKQGEVVGVIGRNGAGKSTLLKVLSRITEPTTGRLSLRGRVGSLLEVGTGFHPELTGRENIFLNGAIMGMTRREIRTRFDEIVAFAEVEKFLDTPVKRYSSGMYVRLAFAVAAHLELEILFVDEVLAVGDAEFQKKCLGKMASVAECGRTILFVSHNMSAVRSLCHRCLLLSHGQVELDGDVESTISTYAAADRRENNLVWSDRNASEERAVYFKEIRVSVCGRQPDISLKCELQVFFKNASTSCLISVDICDAGGFPLMQALPSVSPFTIRRKGLHRIFLNVDLPPLIPGIYAADFWIGPHFSETLHYQKGAIVFEINETPTLGRTFPHYQNHGHIVPKSTIRYTPPPL